MVWFGRYDDPESHWEFDAYLARWLAAGRQVAAEERPPSGLTVKDLGSLFSEHLEQRHGAAWWERNQERIESALRHGDDLCGSLPAEAFTPMRLQDVRRIMIESGRLCRGMVNSRVRLIRRAFRWGATQGFVPVLTAQGLDMVEPPGPGEFGVREGKKREPVAEEVMRATLPYLSPTIVAIVELLWLTGARPSEILGLCPRDLDRTATPWTATLQDHKTARKGKVRMLAFGPTAREVLRRYLNVVPKPAPDLPIFSPKRAMKEHHAARRARRLETGTRLWPSHVDRLAREKAERAKRGAVLAECDLQPAADRRAGDRAAPPP